MRETTLDQFTLSKVKAKGNGLESHFEVVENTAVEVYHDQKQIKSDKSPHPDLLGIFKALREYVAQVFYFNQFTALIDSKAFSPTEAQVTVLREKYKDLCSKIKVTGISVSGKDDNRGVIITAVLTTESGLATAVNTPRLKYQAETYGFEEELEGLITDLEGEVYEYVIKGKQAQLEMAFQDDEVDGKMAAANDLEVVDEEIVNQAEEALNEE